MENIRSILSRIDTKLSGLEREFKGDIGNELADNGFDSAEIMPDSEFQPTQSFSSPENITSFETDDTEFVSPITVQTAGGEGEDEEECEESAELVADPMTQVLPEVDEDPNDEASLDTVGATDELAPVDTTDELGATDELAPEDTTDVGQDNLQPETEPADEFSTTDAESSENETPEHEATETPDFEAGEEEETKEDETEDKAEGEDETTEGDGEEATDSKTAEGDSATEGDETADEDVTEEEYDYEDDK